MCYNLASVLNVIHQRNQYVVVDLKPQNILINFDGKIALIDIDSIQVQTYSKLYHADAHTPEYSPPEFHNKKINYATSKVDANWDYFAFATTAYQILFQLPPFVGTVDGHTEQIENIAKQYFPHGRHRQKYKFIPPPHKEFKALSSDLKQAFIDTFDKEPNERVDFMRWIDSFLLQLKKTPKSKVVNNPFVRKQPKYTSSNNPTGTPCKSLKKSINFLKIFSWVAIWISTFIIKLKSILNILLLVIVGLVIMFYIVGYIQEINKIEVYEDIFNLKNHYTISEDKIKKLLDTQTINGIVWEQYIIETEDGSKIVWIREDDL
jgi:serine/threonine protein kinase